MNLIYELNKIKAALINCRKLIDVNLISIEFMTAYLQGERDFKRASFLNELKFNHEKKTLPMSRAMQIYN